MIHELKTIQPYFDDVVNGVKTFEVRKHDRDFKVGDELILREYNLESNTYSGKNVHMEITYILDSENYCKEGYVVLGIRSIWDRFSKHVKENCVNHEETLYQPTSVDTYDSDFSLEEIIKQTEEHFKELSMEQFEQNLIECGIGKINTCEEDGVIMITHNEICTLCKERTDDGYCYNIGVQTDDEDIEITYCHEFKPLIE